MHADVISQRTPRLPLGAFLASALLAGCLLTACGDTPFQIEEVRTGRSDEGPQPSGVTSADRFGGGALAHGRTSPPPVAASNKPPTRLRWHAPSAWTVLPPRPGREVGFRIGESEDANCVLSVLNGGGGGLTANVNRWRAQMGKPALDAAAVAALESRPFLAGTARVVDVGGTYVGMGQAHVPDARLIGLIAERATFVAFLKMTGPASTVEGQREALFAFASTVKVAPAVRPVTSSGSALRWTVPTGWVAKPARAMREVTFAPAGEVGAECYVAILAGGAGGIDANINRWQGQMGQPALTRGAIAALPRLPALKGEGVLVAIDGNFTGMGRATYADSTLLGFIVEREQDTVFVKFTGPTAVVRAERSRFELFCRSLREED